MMTQVSHNQGNPIIESFQRTTKNAMHTIDARPSIPAIDTLLSSSCDLGTFFSSSLKTTTSMQPPNFTVFVWLCKRYPRFNKDTKMVSLLLFAWRKSKFIITELTTYENVLRIQRSTWIFPFTNKLALENGTIQSASRQGWEQLHSSVFWWRGKSLSKVSSNQRFRDSYQL